MLKLNRYDSMKLIAIILMMIDHIGALFFPNIVLFRIIGRLCMPIFAFCIAEGYKHTKDRKKEITIFKNSKNKVIYAADNIYLYRLFLFACISQIPYTLVFDTTQLNIIFSFFISLLLLKLINNKKYIIIPILIGITLYINYLFSIEIVWLVALMVITFYYRKEWFNDNIILICFIQLIGVWYYIYNGVFIYQTYNIVSSLLLLLLFKYIPMKNIKRKLPKQLFYWFYPLHLVILGFIYYM